MDLEYWYEGKMYCKYCDTPMSGSAYGSRDVYRYDCPSCRSHMLVTTYGRETICDWARNPMIDVWLERIN